MKFNCTRLILFISTSFLFAIYHANSQIILSENFKANFPPSGWTINTFSGTPFEQNPYSFNAVSDSKSIRCYASTYYASNAWAFTTSLSLEANRRYRISYWYMGTSGSGKIEKMKVTIGNGANVTAQPTSIHNYPSGNYLSYSGIQFQWHIASTQNFITAQNSDMEYRCVVTCTNSGIAVYSNIVSVSLANSGSSFRENMLEVRAHIYSEANIDDQC